MILSINLVSLPLELSPKNFFNPDNISVIYTPSGLKRRRRAVFKKDSNSDIKRKAPPSKSVRFIDNLQEIPLSL